MYRELIEAHVRDSFYAFTFILEVIQNTKLITSRSLLTIFRRMLLFERHYNQLVFVQDMPYYW